MTDAPTGSLPVAVGDDLLQAILAPYKPNCRYLKRVDVAAGDPLDDAGPGLVHATGEFTIAESCYIQDTGHFNAVEFNLCYNQLVYVLIGQCVVSKLVPALSSMTLDEYRRRQLPDVLIHDYESTFRKPLDRLRFRGTTIIDEARERSSFLLLRTRVRFWDEAGGRAEGRITLVIVDSGAGAESPRDRAAQGPG